MTRRIRALAAAVTLLALAAALILLGNSSSRRSTASRTLDVMLDYFPNADHAGLFAARADGRFRAVGLDVRIRAPTDPSVPLKLLAAGRTDLAISYEPEVLRARAKGLPVVAVAALVRVPLTAIISLPRAHIATTADLRGKRVATAGIDYQSAYLDAILGRRGVPRNSVTERNAGFELLPALLGGRADAVLGAYWNYEAIDLRQRGRNPRVIRIENAGVPTYDELVVVVRAGTLGSQRDRIVRFLRALREGTRDLAANPARGLNGLLKGNRDLDPKLQRASVSATLPYLLPKPGRPYGYLDPTEWQAFTRFMQRNRLLPGRVVSSADAFTNSLLR